MANVIDDLRAVVSTFPQHNSVDGNAYYRITGRVVEAAVAALEAIPQKGWTCFHCGETFTTPGAARDHFGFEPHHDPACRIKIGAERGLVMELRKAELAAADAWAACHNETLDFAKAYRAQAGRHARQIQEAEELGYTRGLRDAHAEQSEGTTKAAES